MIEKCIKTKLDSLFIPSIPSTDVPLKKMYATLSYVSAFSNHEFKVELTQLVHRFYPQLNLVLIFKNNFSVGSFFKFKDVIPRMLCISVVYKFSCAQCNATYCGETVRHLQTRIEEHKGISSRTGFPLQKSNSCILDHALTTGHDISQNIFQIVHRPKPTIIKIVERVVIHQQKPTLNNMDSSIVVFPTIII